MRRWGLHRWGSRLAAVLLGFAAGILLCEAGLQVYGALERASANRRLRGDSADGRPIVAFCGDSNIYGLYVDDNETLAKRVEELSRANGKRGVRCLNFGVPAAATWAVLDQCKRALELQPAAVVVRAGINNTWQVPPGRGLGFLENFKLVRVARWWNLNRTESTQRNTTLGAGGEAIEGGQLELAGNRAILNVSARDEKSSPLALSRSNRNFAIDVIGPRMRADFLAIAELCQKAGARLVLASYLENRRDSYVDIHNLMLLVAKSSGCGLADCGNIVAEAVGGPADAPPPVLIARRAALLTRDLHPTALGYACEAVVVSRALAELLVLDSPPATDPIAPFRATPIDVPKIRATAPPALRFEVYAKPGDRVSLLLGETGNSLYKDVPLSLTTKGLQEKAGVGTPAAPLAEAGADGIARFVINNVSVERFPPRILAAAVIERGGKYGAARILATPAIEVSMRVK